MKELIEDLRNGHVPNYISAPRTTDLVMNEAADAIERLENESVAADIRIENDSVIIEGLTREQIGLALDAARYRSMGGAL